MGIGDVKRELYDSLKSYVTVKGAGIREDRGKEYIVIFLSKNDKNVLDRIPASYKGKKVKTEVIGIPRAM